VHDQVKPQDDRADQHAEADRVTQVATLRDAIARVGGEVGSTNQHAESVRRVRSIGKPPHG
jgi:hypothetical protein